MQLYDVNAAKASDIELDYQNQTTKNRKTDVSSFPFFTYVNDDVFNTPTFQSYYKLKRQFNPDLTQPEIVTQEKTMNIETFLDLAMNATVFNIMWQFLIEKNVTTNDYQTFKSLLKNLWFGLYDRSPNGTILSSSGWEHVFCGEWKSKNEVDGLHSWAQYHWLENETEINYYGYIRYEGTILPTIQFKWQKYFKAEDSFMIGTSVEFDFSVFTLCYLAKPGEDKCKFTLGNYRIYVTSQTQSSPGGPYIATTFPASDN